MSTLQQSHDGVVDLESEDCKDDGENNNINNGGNNNNNINKDKVEGEEDEKRRGSNVSECSVDLEFMSPETRRMCLGESTTTVKDCRICHLSMDATNSQDYGMNNIELGCSCKDDLAAAHKQCAEAWFKIKGNTTCEICGSIAQNVTGIPESDPSNQWDDQTNDGGGTTTAASSIASTPMTETTRNFWQGQRFLNFLLACMVFAFVVSWLFHFNMP